MMSMNFHLVKKNEKKRKEKEDRKLESSPVQGCLWHQDSVAILLCTLPVMSVPSAAAMQLSRLCLTDGRDDDGTAGFPSDNKHFTAMLLESSLDFCMSSVQSPVLQADGPHFPNQRDNPQSQEISGKTKQPHTSISTIILRLSASISSSASVDRSKEA